MNIYTSTQARANLFNLIDEASNSHEPIYIKGKRNDVVMISKEDYESIQETLYLYSTPGLVNQIMEASNESLSECESHEIVWK